ncbi:MULTISPECIES: VOC family protein [Pseudoalteromonas]|uniref:VOC family protein n=1 Tax=Pseudoalteromonas TaxID=53246 RepID=UPI000FFE6FFA|nr:MULTISPECIES: VOC family protein [Pseudoalteromonas]MCG9757686.1 glyoxalase [Pseudoalteromonas sp. Isolate6]NKC17519.1 glyoxalase [Pseudoalteromonas galatheae]RXE84445.1 glyoxalase [Pseudoalteromonas sp. A757]
MFAKTVIYVECVEEVLDFYYQAFGLSTFDMTDEGDYGELDTGEVKLAFASHPLAQSQFRQDYIRCHPKQPALGFEISISCENVPECYDKAVAAGAEPLSPPNQKGRVTQAYVRAIEGTLVALVSKPGE